MKTTEILGVPVDAVTAPEALAEIKDTLDSGRRLHVVTVNNEMIMRAQSDARFRKVIAKAGLRVPDTAGVVWASDFNRRQAEKPVRGMPAYGRAFSGLVKLLLVPGRVQTVIPRNVPGADLVIDIAGMCEEFDYHLFLLGGGPGVAEATAEKLKTRFPQLHVVGAMPGSPEGALDEDARTILTGSGAHVLLVAYGPPKQEMWIARNLPHLPAPLVAVGVGGSFDYLAGTISVEGGRPAKQPPGWVRRRGLEWLWRLGTQPSRWRRIVTALPAFVIKVVRQSYK